MQPPDVSHSISRRVAIIGGGISGLAAALRVTELDPAANVTLVEASHRLRGGLQVVRRFGREAFDRLIQPLIGGIYTADPSKLSMAATLPQFLEMEQRCGSVVRGVRRRESGVGDRDSGARYGQFVAPRQGMQRLVD